MLYRIRPVGVMRGAAIGAVASVALLLGSLPALADSPSPSSASPDAGASAVASAYASVSPDTGALAINTTSGSSVFALAFDIKFVTGDTVAPTNLALAYSSCTACQTVAISIQVVIYENGASNVSPQNAAIAVNNMCNLCDTLASAYQIVLGESGPVTLTDDGARAIYEIRQKLLALQNQKGLTGPQIQAQLDALMAQLLQVLQTQLVPLKDERHGQHDDGQGPGGVTLIAPTPRTGAYSPPASASPSGSPTASPSPSASATQVSPTP